MGKKLTTEEFIERAKLIHGEKYDYSLVEYLDKRHKVKIICSIHGVFEQSPNQHYSGSNCEKCGYLAITKNTEIFIKKAKEVHGDKYDYILVDYKMAKFKTKIICSIHGVFEQLISNHLAGRGCPKCAGKNKTTEEWILEAKSVHGEIYDYSKVDYINKSTKVKIICPTHGEFEQTPESHLKGSRCFKCFGTKKYTLIEFIEKSNLIHNNKYDYSLSEYINKRHKIKIICPSHGEFEQVAGEHLRGSGCLKCNESLGEREIAKALFQINVLFERQYKFKDCKNINTLPFDFFIPALNTTIEFQGIQHYEIDEWFNKTQEDLDYIQNNDRIKKEYCINNNIPLIIIPFTEFKNIRTILGPLQSLSQF